MAVAHRIMQDKVVVVTGIGTAGHRIPASRSAFYPLDRMRDVSKTWLP